MIYTSYFAKLKKLPLYCKPVSICAKPPIGYTGLQYTKLAPTYSILMEYKRNQDEEQYIKRFKQEILDKLNPQEVINELLTMVRVNNFEGILTRSEIVLVCYEKSSNFCHRHLVANWLNKNGIKCKEYEFK